MSRSLIPVLTPHGSLRLDQAEDEFSLEDGLAERLEKCFARGSGHGLLQLGAGEAGTSLPSSLAWWRDFALRFVADLCALGETAQADERRHLPTPAASDLTALIDKAPPMQGGEYLQRDVLIALWQATERALEIELSESKLPLQDFLKARNSRWRLVGRVHFNLAENRRDPDYPFAFMATYTSGLSADGVLRHLPLGKALREYAGIGDKAKLLQLLAPIQQASEACAWLKTIVDAGEIFHPLRWTPQGAVRFLQDVEAMERAGLVIRMPANWRMNRPSRPSVETTVGSTSPSVLGMDALLDFRVQVSLDGEILTIEEINELLASTHGLALLRGKWVEVDPTRLRATLDKFQAIERLSEKEGVPFGQAMRLLAGAEIGAAASAAPTAQWAHVQADPWLAGALEGCRSPEGLARVDPGAALQATLRPYQQTGVRWLYLLTLILGSARNLVAENTSVRGGGWQQSVGDDMAGRTLGVLGLGNVGGAVARIGKAFGMKVIAWSQNLTAERAAEAGAALVTKDELFQEADVVSIHLVLSGRTRGLVGAAELALMKPTARLINTSRTPIVVEADLVAALKDKKIAGAAIDVFDQEPLPLDHPFRALPNLLATPHIGYVSRGLYARFYQDTVTNICRWLDGQAAKAVGV